MSRPAELEQLLEDLRTERPVSNVAVQPESKMVIVVDETEARYEFDGDEAKLLLSSTESVGRLFEAINYPEETFFELHALTVDPDVMTELESFAATVDEM